MIIFLSHTLYSGIISLPYGYEYDSILRICMLHGVLRHQMTWFLSGMVCRVLVWIKTLLHSLEYVFLQCGCEDVTVGVAFVKSVHQNSTTTMFLIQNEQPQRYVNCAPSKFVTSLVSHYQGHVCYIFPVKFLSHETPQDLSDGKSTLVQVKYLPIFRMTLIGQCKLTVTGPQGQLFPYIPNPRQLEGWNHEILCLK